MALIKGCPAKIAGTGMYVPEKIMTNADFEKIIDTSDEWITTRTGIKQRHFASAAETLTFMAAKAAEAAIADAGLSAEDIDMILVGSSTPDTVCPPISARVQDAVGAVNAGAFDTIAACTSSLSGMVTAAAGVASGIWKNVLVIGVESFSNYIDWQDRKTCILFGDGAGAAVVSAGKEDGGGFYAAKLLADGSKSHFITIESNSPDEARVVRMKGNDVFKFVNKVMPGFLKDFCAEAGTDPADVDMWVMHQANTRINEGVLKKLGVPMDKTLINLDSYGNTSAASMMITLHEAIRAGQFRKGGKAALVAFGSGMTLGAMLYEV